MWLNVVLAIVCRLGSKSESGEPEREADFFEPVTYEWNEDIQVARNAAREYSERATAEY